MTMGHGIYGLREPELPKKTPSRWRYLWRVVFFLAFCALAMMFVLSRADGPSDSNKALLEDILGDLVAPNFKIGTLHQLTYSPVVGVDIEDTTFGMRSHADRIQYAAGLVSWITGSVEFRVLAAEDLFVEGGLFMMPLDLELDKAIIDISTVTAPVFRASGQYGGAPLALEIPMVFKPTFLGHPRFVLPKTTSLSMDLGEIALAMTIDDPFGLRSVYTISSLTQGKGLPWSGVITLKPEWSGTSISGHLVRGGARIDFSLLRPQDETQPISGTMTVEDLSDTAWRDLVRIVQELRALYKGRGGLSIIEMQDVHVTVQQADGAEKEWIIRDRALVSNPFSKAP